VCRPEHSFLYRYEYVHLRVSWPRMASGNIIFNYGYFYLWRQSRRKLSGYVFLHKWPSLPSFKGQTSQQKVPIIMMWENGLFSVNFGPKMPVFLQNMHCTDSRATIHIPEG
jgi:hypothetical protein